MVSDQIGCPTFTGHLAAALIELAVSPPAGVLHVAAAEHCSWFQFASAIVAAAGLSCEVRGISAADYPSPTARPANSVLGSERGAPALPSWERGLQEFMSRLEAVPA